jgi:hypothetical protein
MVSSVLGSSRNRLMCLRRCGPDAVGSTPASCWWSSSFFPWSLEKYRNTWQVGGPEGSGKDL